MTAALDTLPGRQQKNRRHSRESAARRIGAILPADAPARGGDAVAMQQKSRHTNAPLRMPPHSAGKFRARPLQPDPG
jgi:hypothetical protein